MAEEQRKSVINDEYGVPLNLELNEEIIIFSTDGSMDHYHFIRYAEQEGERAIVARRLADDPDGEEQTFGGEDIVEVLYPWQYPHS